MKEYDIKELLRSDTVMYSDVEYLTTLGYRILTLKDIKIKKD